MCYVQLPNGPTSFKSTSVKPYSRSKNTHDVKLDELEVPVKPDELESPLPTSEVPQELQYPHRPSLTQQPTKQQYNP